MEPVQPDEDLAGPGGQARPYHVLLVDDDPLLRETLVLQLEYGDFTVTAVESGVEALQVLATSVVVDVLLTDLSMPEHSGFEVIEMARRHRPGLRTVLLTGFALDDDSLASAPVPDSGFAFLRKPVRGAELTGTINALLGASVVIADLGSSPPAGAPDVTPPA